jgi:hypothetical protein
MGEFTEPLVLSTPHMTGVKVHDCQWLLAGNNRFPGLAPYKDGTLDGDYGPLTSQATSRAKFWCGYALSACDGVFGQRIYEYLRPLKWRPLPKSYQVRRAERLAAAAETPGMKALKFGVGELGTTESPAGSNRTKYGVDYGFNGVPWCAIFESYCFKYGATRPSYHYAAVEQIYSDATYGRNGLRIVRTPQAGDVALYSFGTDRFAHTGFFKRWLNQAGGSFEDLAGNTGSGDRSNGGAVALGDWPTVSQVLAFVRVG